MQVRDWMTEQVETVQPDDSIGAVRTRFHQRRVRQFPVVGAGRLVGIITDRDVRSTTDLRIAVDAAMTPDPVTATPGLSVEAAAALICRYRIGALPVLENGILVGIISESDLLSALVELCAVLEPTTLIELDCAEGREEIERARRVVQNHGGRVPWTSGTPDGNGRQTVALRVRMSIGGSPEQLFEEAGFRVLSSISGRTVAAVCG